MNFIYKKCHVLIGYDDRDDKIFMRVDSLIGDYIRAFTSVEEPLLLEYIGVNGNTIIIKDDRGFFELLNEVVNKISKKLQSANE